MASFAELKWRTVIGRNDEFRSIFRDGDAMFLELQHPHSGRISTRETPIQEFYLPRMRYVFREKLKVNVTLVFRRYRLGVILPDEYRVLMRWLPFWYPVDNGYQAVFLPHPDKVFLLFPVSGQVYTTLPAPQSVRALSARALTEDADRRMATSLISHIASQVPRTIRSNVVRVKNKPPFSSIGSRPTSPTTIIKNNEDGGEQLNQPYVFTYQAYTAYSRVFSSTRTPGFRALHKSQLPVNPFSCTIRKVDNRQALTRRDHTNPDGWVVRTSPTLGGLFSNAPLNAVHDVQSTNKAIAKLTREMDVDVKFNIVFNFL